MYCLDVEENYKERKDEVVQLIKKIIGDKKFNYRGDYTCFSKDSFVLLLGDTSNFKLPHPGDINKAIWMMRAIIAVSIILMRDKVRSELTKNCILTSYQEDKLLKFVKFIVLIYLSWWVTCPLPADTPINDLKLLEEIKKYPYQVISSAADKGLLLHSWYRTEEMVQLDLFSP